MAAEKAKAVREVGDEALRAATGRTWQEWEDALDARGAERLSHKEIVALLLDGLVDGAWWAQTLAGGYERRKGTRVGGQTADGAFQVGVRRTLPISPANAWRLITSPEGLRAWLGDAPGLVLRKGATYATGDGAAGEVRVAKEGSHLRMTWQPPGWPRASTLQVRVMPAGERATISFHQEGIPGAAAREERRRHFEAAADALQRQSGADSPG